MNIKNNTSAIEASKSMARIEGLLVGIGAININKQVIHWHHLSFVGSTTAANTCLLPEGAS